MLNPVAATGSIRGQIYDNIYHRCVGVLSKESGVNAETIRYYERTGLLPKPPRSASGYRRYDETAAKRLRFIRRGREIGFGLSEIKALLHLADRPDQPCRDVDRLAQNHLTEVETKIQDLLAMREILARLAGCQSPNAKRCRLIEALDQRQCCIHE